MANKNQKNIYVVAAKVEIEVPIHVGADNVQEAVDYVALLDVRKLLTPERIKAAHDWAYLGAAWVGSENSETFKK